MTFPPCHLVAASCRLESPRQQGPDQRATRNEVDGVRYLNVTAPLTIISFR